MSWPRSPGRSTRTDGTAPARAPSREPATTTTASRNPARPPAPATTGQPSSISTTPLPAQHDQISLRGIAPGPEREPQEVKRRVLVRARPLPVLAAFSRLATSCDLPRSWHTRFFANSACIRGSAIADLPSLDSARSRISSARPDSPSGASGFFPDSAASRATLTHLPRVGASCSEPAIAMALSSRVLRQKSLEASINSAKQVPAQVMWLQKASATLWLTDKLSALIPGSRNEARIS